MRKYFITISDILYRRIPKNDPNFWKELNGVKILSSAGFKTKSYEDGLSVDIAELTTPKKSLALYPNFVLAKIPASIPIDEGYECEHKPSNKNKSHAIIKGNTKPIARKLAFVSSKSIIIE